MRGKLANKIGGCLLFHSYLEGVRVAALSPVGDDFSARFYLTNHIDSVKLVTDGDGMVVSRTEYYPYGETFVNEGEEKSLPKFGSQELDKESGYYFFNTRHYDPVVSRFVTADTVIDGEGDTQGWNRFSYVKGNPVGYKDPSGHYSDKLFRGTEVKGTVLDNASVGITTMRVDKDDTLNKLVEARVKDSVERGIKTNFKAEMNKVLSWNPQIKDKNKIAEGSRIITDVTVRVSSTTFAKIINKLPTFTGQVSACGAGKASSGLGGGGCLSIGSTLSGKESSVFASASAVGGLDPDSKGSATVGLRFSEKKTKVTAGVSFMNFTVEADLTDKTLIELRAGVTTDVFSAYVQKPLGSISDSVKFKPLSKRIIQRQVDGLLKGVRRDFDREKEFFKP